MSRWIVVVPFKGAADGKSRLAAEFDARERAVIAFAFLVDTLAAARAVPAVARVIVVSGRPGLGTELSAALPARPGSVPAAVEVVDDPGGGINAAIAAGVARGREVDALAFVAALTGDLASLNPSDLEGGLMLAETAASAGHAVSFVADHHASGTTMVAVAPGVDAETHFGVRSSAAHITAGYLPLAVPAESSLRFDIDDANDLARAWSAGLGDATRDAVLRLRSSGPATPPVRAPGGGRGRER